MPSLGFYAFRGPIKENFVSSGIKFWQWGNPWTHVAIRVPGTEKREVWEAVFPRVRRGSLDENYEKGREYDFFLIDVNEQQIGIAEKFLDQQIGKSYDILGLFGFISRQSWQAPDKWMCSELAAATCKVMNFPLYDWKFIEPWQLSPHLFVASPNMRFVNSGNI